MVSSSQIRERVAMFLDHRIDLDAFEDWFVQNTWNIHLSGSTAAEALTFQLEESLSELSSGHLTPDEFRSELEYIVHRDNVAVAVDEAPQAHQVVFRFVGSSAPVVQKLLVA